MKTLVLCDNVQTGETLALAKGKSLGIEIQAFAELPVLDNPPEAIARHLSLLDGFHGLRTMHGPMKDLCPGSADPLVRWVAAHRFRQALDISTKIGAKHVVFHHGYVPHTSYVPNWITRCGTFWREILTEVPVDTHIHLENLFEKGPDIFLGLLDEIRDPRIGVCLDLGHAHAFSEEPAVEWVEALGAAITYVHLHDNRGKEDEHLQLGQGNLPTKEILGSLQLRAPDAIWAIETEVATMGQSLQWLEESGFLAI